MSAPLSASATTSDGEPAGDPIPGLVVVDASVWVSRLVPKDTFHQPVRTWMVEQRSRGTILLSPSLLLAEVAGAISRRTGEPRLARNAIDALTRLPGLRLIAMDQSIVQEAARLAADLGLRGADSFYVAVAVRLNLSLLTLDQDQRARAAPLVDLQTLD